MSHIVTITTQIRDPVALNAACNRLSLSLPTVGTAKLFSTEATGHCIQLPKWRYPVVCHLETGQLSYDNYGGRWGDERHLNRLVQAYAVENSWRSQCPCFNGVLRRIEGPFVWCRRFDV